MAHPRRVAVHLILLLAACKEPAHRELQSKWQPGPADAGRPSASDAAPPPDAALATVPPPATITECAGLTTELDRLYASYAPEIDQLAEALPPPAAGERMPDTLLLRADGVWIPIPADDYEIRMERATQAGRESPRLTLRGKRFRLSFSRSPWAEPMRDLTPPGASGALIERKAAVLARERYVPMLRQLLDAYGKTRADFRCDPRRFDAAVKLWLLYAWKAALGESGRIKDLRVHRDVAGPGSLVMRGVLQGQREVELHLPAPGGAFAYKCVALADGNDEQYCLRLMAHAGLRRPRLAAEVAPRPLQLAFAAGRRDRLAARALLLVPKLELPAETRATLTWIGK